MVWYDEVCIEKNLEEEIKPTFLMFNLKYGKDFWEVCHWDGTMAMMVVRNRQVFKIILDKDLSCAKILLRNTGCNNTTKERYHVVKDSNNMPIMFFGFDIWLKILCFLFGDVKFYDR